jgi:hypothetical protein
VTPLASSLFLAAALKGSLELGDRTEARFTGTTSPTTYSAEVMTNPSALLRLDMRRWEISARYAPSLTLRGLGIEPALDILHQGRLEASIEASRRLTLSISGEGSYGTVRFLSPTLSEAGFASAQPVDTLPGLDTITFASLNTSIGAAFAATRRLKLEANAGYYLSGGVDEASQDAYPQIAGPRAHLGAEYSLTRRDSARSTADATWVSFSTGEEAFIGQLTEAWVHRFTRRTTSTLGLGVALDSTRPADGADRQTVLYPVAEADLNHRVPARRLELGIGLRVAPVIDRLRGEVDPRLLLDASAAYQANRRVSVWAQAGGSQSIPWGERDALTLAFSEAGVRLHLADWVDLVNGARAAYQFREETEPHRLQWMIFSGAMFTAPRIRF